MQSHSRSLVTGTTAADRRVVVAVNLANGDPTSSGQGVSVQLFDAVDVVARCTGGGGSFDVKVWWWYNASETWVYDDKIGAATVDPITGIVSYDGLVSVTTAGGAVSFPILNQPNGRSANAVYIEVDNFAGGAAVTAEIWLSGRSGVHR